MAEPAVGQSRRGWLVLAVALVFPTLLTLGFFELLAGTIWQYLVYAPGKLLQFAFPVFYLYWIAGWRPGRPARCNAAELTTGLVSGALIGLAGWLLYAHVLLPFGVLDQAATKITAQIQGFGIGSIGLFALTALLYSVVHSGLEEYYWRWFVFGRALAIGLRPVPAVLIASLGFAAHHVVVLGRFFGYFSVWTWLLSACIAVGGAFWCWMWLRFGRLWGAWLSHGLIDAAIFTIGYDIAFRSAG